MTETDEPRPRKGHRAMLDEAIAAIRRVSAVEAIAMAARPDIRVVDVRDIRELEREGRIPGALHAPRGMLEFWIDPESPYHRAAFAEPVTFLFVCALGWRSALATRTAQDMGLDAIDLDGGFEAWRAAGGPVEPPPASRR